MKKLFLIALFCFGFVFGLTACSGNNPTGTEPSTEPEQVDLSKVIFKDAEYEYTGDSYELTAFYVPEGVTVEYTNHIQSEVGTYEVTATFKDGSGNVIKTMTATLTITPVTAELYFLCDACGWVNDDAFKLEGVDGIYQYTAELAAGTQFKIANSDNWDTQYNIGGVFGDFAAFTNGSEADGTANDNVCVKEAGTYTFYLDPTNNKLEVEKDGVKLEKVNGSIYYLKGSINGWSASPAQRLVLSEDGKSASVVVTLAVGDQFKLSAADWIDAVTMSYTHIASHNYPQFVLGTDNDNIKCIAAGTYRVTVSNYEDPFNSEKFAAQVLTIEVIEGGDASGYVPPKNEYYLVGNIGGADFWNFDDATRKLVVDGETASISISLAAGDVFKVSVPGWATQFDFAKLTFADQSLAANFKEGVQYGNIEVVTGGNYVLTITGYGTNNEVFVISLAK